MKTLTRSYLEGLHFDDRRMLLDEQVSGIAAVIEDHVRLPVLTSSDAVLDTPPKWKKLNINKKKTVNVTDFRVASFLRWMLFIDVVDDKWFLQR